MRRKNAKIPFRQKTKEIRFDAADPSLRKTVTL